MFSFRVWVDGPQFRVLGCTVLDCEVPICRDHEGFIYFDCMVWCCVPHTTPRIEPVSEQLARFMSEKNPNFKLVQATRVLEIDVFDTNRLSMTTPGTEVD